MNRQRWARMLIAISSLGVVMAPLEASAAIPQQIAFQGKLTDTQNQPLEGEIQMTFSLFKSKTGGTALWSEAKPVTVTQGLFSTQLGDTTLFPSTLTFSEAYWIELQVGTEPPLAPRQPLATSPYTFRAKQVEGLTVLPGNPSATPPVHGTLCLGPYCGGGSGRLSVSGPGGEVSFQDRDSTSWSDTDRWVVYHKADNLRILRGTTDKVTVTLAGNVGIGTATPTTKLDVTGNVKTSGQFMLGNVRFGAGSSLPGTGDSNWKYRGSLFIRTSDGKLFVNTAVDGQTIVWTVVGSQS